MAAQHEVVCAFVDDDLGSQVVEQLAEMGVQLIALRSAGYNHVDLPRAAELGLKTVRVPEYSPNAVAEHTVGLMLALNRKLYRAYNRVREGNFALHGLLGFDFVGRTVGVIGTGKIGRIVARIMVGFGCRVLGYDRYPSDEGKDIGVEYVQLNELLEQSDIVTLHCPLFPETHYLICEATLATMKPGVMLINTSRGGLVDTRAAITALKTGQLGGLGIDVYEEEAALFFEDRSEEILRDDVFARLLTFPQRSDHRPSSILYRTSDDGNRQNHAR